MRLSGYDNRGIYMSKGLDFLMLEKSNIYTQVSNIIKFFFDTYELDYADEYHELEMLGEIE